MTGKKNVDDALNLQHSNNKLTGFTVIEMIVVIVIIAILTTMAVPRFLSQTSTARQNSTNNLASALAAASASNYAQRSANSSLGSAISNCTQISALLNNGNGLPSGYTITSRAVSAGASVNCTLTGAGSTTAVFIGLGIS
jgi:prepilin-type N-terminal cleavage/methylation domain-containing protein